MARYTGPSWKVARRLKFSILENGKELQKRAYAPGQHGQRRVKLSEYGLQLQEKQKVRNVYGMNEKQFYNTFVKAGKLPGKHGVNFLIMLESRLDNLVYRLGFATTRRQARQLVNHGHVTVNGKKVNIPSYRCKVGDVIAIKENKRELAMFKELKDVKVVMPKWLEFDPETLTGKILALPVREDVDVQIAEHMIVELYSK